MNNEILTIFKQFGLLGGGYVIILTIFIYFQKKIIDFFISNISEMRKEYMNVFENHIQHNTDTLLKLTEAINKLLAKLE